MSRQGDLDKIHVIQYKGWWEEAKKQNEALIQQAQEMGAAINFLKRQGDARLRVMFACLYELGGSITVSNEALGEEAGKIEATEDKEAGTTTFYIVPIPPEEEVQGESMDSNSLTIDEASSAEN
jgi:hypothetical protein